MEKSLLPLRRHLTSYIHHICNNKKKKSFDSKMIRNCTLVAIILILILLITKALFLISTYISSDTSTGKINQNGLNLQMTA